MISEDVKIIDGIEHKENCVQTKDKLRCNIFNVSEFGKEMDEFVKEFLSELVD